MKIISCLYKAVFILLEMACRISSIQQPVVKKLCVVCMLISSFTIVSQNCHAGWVPYDDFSDGVRDEQKWHYAYWEGGKSPQENDGSLILSVGGGTSSMRLPLEVELEQAGIDFSEAVNHSLIGIKDPEITGVRLDIVLSGGAPLESGVLLGFFERTGPQEISHASIELGKWDDGVRLNFEKELFANGEPSGGESKLLPANLGETYRVTMLRDSGTIKVFKDTELIATYPSTGKQIGYFIAAFNDAGLPMSATADNVQVFYPDSAPAIEGFSLIPAGAFTMGNSVAADTDITDAPARTVTLDAFYMGKYEVTKAEWDEVKTWGLTNGYTDLADGAGKAGNHPVHSISWYDMVKWCNARSQKEGLAPVYYTNDAQTTIYKTGSVDVTNAQVKWTANGYRPPTETEWEKAARGGLSGKRFPWGDTINHDQSNFKNFENEDYQSGTRDYHPQYSVELQPYTAPVGSFDPNGYDLHDMAGNVWEMCWDIYGSYPSGNLNNPRGALSGAYRTFRGGSWDDEASCMRVALRGDDGLPGLKDEWTGFRLARSAIRTSINGEVTDRNGSPLSGVAVTAHQYSPDGDSSNSLAWASTDASGKYALEGLDPGTYRIRFNGSANEPPLSDLAPQYFNNAPSLALAQDVVLTSLGSVNNIDAILKEASRITGNITSAADGNPLGDILVLAHRMMGNGEWDWSSWVNFTSSKSDGSYALNLPEGAYMVSFYDYNNKYYITEFYDNQRKSDNAQPIILQANSTVSNINASLAEGARIEGVVRADANSAPLQSISVSVHEYDEGDDCWQDVGWVETDQNGAYSLGGLGAGTYRVEFSDYNGVYASEAYNDATNIELAGDIVVAESAKITGINASLAKASSISGKVTGLNGVALNNVDIDLKLLGDDGNWYTHEGTETDKDGEGGLLEGDGEYHFGGLKSGVYRIEFEDDSGQYASEYHENAVEFDLAKDINLGKEQHLTINASMVLGSRITGKVTGPNGSSLADVWAEAFRLNSKGKWEWYDDAQANSDGIYQIDGLPNGTYRVGFLDDENFYSVQFHGNTGSTMYLELAKNFVISSPQTISGVIGKFNERAATIAGNVRDTNGEPLSGVGIEAYRKDSQGAWRLVLSGDMDARDNGFFDAKMLPAGTYRFKFEKEGYITNYYGNSPTLNNAKDIVVGDGGSIDGIDVVMLKVGSNYTQTIGTFANIVNKAFGDAPFTVTAPTSTSSLPVTLSVKSGPATISGNTVTITGAGTVMLAANQAGNANYNAASEVTTSFSVSMAISPPITLSGTLMVSSYSKANGTYEYHYFKSPNQLFFLDYEESGEHSYTFSSMSGRLNDLDFDEVFILSFVSASKGEFTFSNSWVTKDGGSFFLYDSTWDLDFDGVPDGLQIERGNLPNLIHPLDLSSDVDGDGLSLAREGELGTNPNKADIAPSITAQPVTAMANQGASASFTVTATGTNPSYQWKRNGADLAGQTGAQLLLNNLQGTQAGSYTVVVSNAIGSETSTVAQLAVVIPPGITVQPVAATANQGASASFSVTATGTNLSYQWKRNGADLAGETGDTLVLDNLQGTQTGFYTVVVSNAIGSVTGDDALLTVVIPPAITAQPAAATANQGASASFSVTATGTNLSYQWKRNGADLAGEAGVMLSLNNLQGTQAGSYTVAVSNSAGSVTSNAAVLTVLGITSDLDRLILNVGAAMSYVVTANPAPTTYAAKSLPAGLKINAKTGVIFGKPTKAGEYTVTLQALRKGAATLSAVKTFRVLQAPTFKLPAKVNVTRNKAFRSAPKVSAYPTASFSVFSGALPEGITLNPITGQISGKTGTLKGNYPVTIRGSNEAGTTDKNTVLVVK
jgi:formylglycine-generating enzyme required for sulfatase activity